MEHGRAMFNLLVVVTDFANAAVRNGWPQEEPVRYIKADDEIIVVVKNLADELVQYIPVSLEIHSPEVIYSNRDGQLYMGAVNLSQGLSASGRTLSTRHVRYLLRDLRHLVAIAVANLDKDPAAA